jgi:hypothetical protein
MHIQVKFCLEKEIIINGRRKGPSHVLNFRNRFVKDIDNVQMKCDGED